ncbi:MAG: hypothetical protein RSA20_07025 [Oscillospiraceae bacterium]
MKNSASKSTLFLMELVISILFFAITGAVCVQVFARAHIYSVQTKQMNFATSHISTLAAYVKTENGNLEQIAQKLEGSFEQGRVEIFYDAQGEQVLKQQAAYVMTAEKTELETVQASVQELPSGQTIVVQSIPFHKPITLKEAQDYGKR